MTLSGDNKLPVLGIAAPDRQFILFRYEIANVLNYTRSISVREWLLGPPFCAFLTTASSSASTML